MRDGTQSREDRKLLASVQRREILIPAPIEQSRGTIWAWRVDKSEMSGGLMKDL